ncbi:MAG: hypothetical protein ACPGRC_00385 [Salibacteraceae bacterium]
MKNSFPNSGVWEPLFFVFSVLFSSVEVDSNSITLALSLDDNIDVFINETNNNSLLDDFLMIFNLLKTKIDKSDLVIESLESSE